MVKNEVPDAWQKKPQMSHPSSRGKKKGEFGEQQASQLHLSPWAGHGKKVPTEAISSHMKEKKVTGNSQQGFLRVDHT